MKEKKKSAVSWILTWAGQKRIAYVWSVLLAIGNVIFKIGPDKKELPMYGVCYLQSEM